MMNHGPTRLIFDSSVQRRSGGGSSVGSMHFLGSAADGGWGAAAEEVGRRRPFYTVAGDEMWDEDYYDEQQPEKKRRLTPEQVDTLEKSFEAENKLEPERKSELAKKLGLQPRQVAVWFQNRRARWKTKQLENDFDCLKSSYDSLLADHHSLLKDNDSLRAQVIMLTEKLQQKEAAESAIGLKQEEQDHSGGDHEATHVQNSPSTGSGGSAVLSQVVARFVDSSGESYFQDSCYHDVDVVGNRIHSEEDDGSDDDCSYLTAVFQEHDHPENAAVLVNYWVWDWGN